VDAFAVVREASTRVLHMRHFNVQLLGGICLHQGRIAEMRTGEGKTLISTLPAYLNALSGKPVHIVTVNEYLAKRDAEWMGKVHKFLGLSVGFVYSAQTPEQKRQAYLCDIVYGTNSEFGFDYLRDNMAIDRRQMLARGYSYVIIDEIDSILIDEARTPLIISGPSGESSQEYAIADKFAKNLTEEDYSIDEKQKTIHLTESGVAKAERFYNIANLTDVDNTDLNHNINNAIRARFIMKRDNDYIVSNDEVYIVDEFTGRIMVGRRFSNGLHQAIEAKEGVKVKAENKTLATITLQNFFKLYEKMSGMTGTAQTEEGEFRDIYGLDVVVIPTNLPMIRVDENDEFYFSHEAKIRAIVNDITNCVERKQPVLVGTTTVERSEEISKILRSKKIAHNVLNAKNHMREAEIVAQAGKIGAVTIATNMAGRGTDILLGGNAEFMAKEEMKKAGYSDEMIEEAVSYAPTTDEEIIKAKLEFQKILAKHKEVVSAEKEEVKALGGLRIIGTERHESRRIDNQLRGRAGRQGDPGSSVFYISADDDLARIFGSERLKKMASMFKLEEDASIKMKFFSKSVETAQKKVEGRNYSVRRQVVEYDNVMNKQREEVYEERSKILDKISMHDKVLDMISESASSIVDQYMNFEEVEDADIDGFNMALEQRIIEPGTNFITSEFLETNSKKEVEEVIIEKAIQKYKQKTDDFKEKGVNIEDIERLILLKVLDKKWISHIDEMDELRQGIGLRAYGNQNPINIYQREGFDMFEEMIESMRVEVANIMLAINVEIGAPHPKMMPKRPSAMEHSAKGTVTNTKSSVGRNDVCPCGSGKKYKNCYGKES
ncbi:MAG: preprotein translocase subunit SecA, partial [Clostridia bacterium]|nr:preprotein translocase subunit SecA [Clostridia bacterium]